MALHPLARVNASWMELFTLLPVPLLQPGGRDARLSARP
jgi:hypothetical protein